MKFDRCRKLFKNFNQLQQIKVLICGVGGVGGYALDCLHKSGVQNITIIDYDKFEVTNQNRQIGSQMIGESKVKVLSTIYPNISYLHQKIDKKFVESFDFDKFDIVIDAIDDLDAKIALIEKTYYKLISSMGAAKRIDPTKIVVSDIWKTTIDPFAKSVRQRLKKIGFNGNFQVVYSTEMPIKCEMGSFVGVTGAFGFTLCSEVMKKVEDVTHF